RYFFSFGNTLPKRAKNNRDENYNKQYVLAQSQ
ncbi:MAG: hypothetical protein ACI9MS_003008, partial [Glaciecola sp.]